MRKIVVSVQNGLLAESISRMLEESREFSIYRSAVGSRSTLAKDCVMYGAEIVLMEVSPGRGLSLQARMEEIRQIKSANTGCKVALAKKDGRVDAFFYSSVTGSYLVAALAAL